MFSENDFDRLDAEFPELKGAATLTVFGHKEYRIEKVTTRGDESAKACIETFDAYGFEIRPDGSNASVISGTLAGIEVEADGEIDRPALLSAIGAKLGLVLSAKYLNA